MSPTTVNTLPRTVVPALHGVTLPPSSPFWDSFMPSNGWNCRCTAIQVRRGKYPQTDIAEAMERGEAATAHDKRGMMRFNPGKERSIWPAYNPYTTTRCRDCDRAQGHRAFARKSIESNVNCAACNASNKSAASILRHRYLKEMEPLLNKTYNKVTNSGNTITVGFTARANSHLYSDTFTRSNILCKDDLKNLGDILEHAVPIGDAPLNHPSNYNIQHFYYFKGVLRGREIRLNVGKRVYKRKDGQIETSYVLYSINDIKKNP